MYFLRMAGREDTRALSLGSNGGRPSGRMPWGGGCEAPGSACWQPVLGFLLPREVKGDKRWRRLADLC